MARNTTVMLRWSAVLIALSWIGAVQKVSAEVTAQQVEKGVVIQLDGQPFAEYVILSGNKPIVWPIIGPTGVPMTRAYPMVADDPSEKNAAKDHVHHRSMWFAHDVNGIDFWTEPATYAGKNKKKDDRLVASLTKEKEPATQADKKAKKAKKIKKAKATEELQPVLGTTKHREFVKVESGREATIVTRNDWLGPDGKPVCEDERTLVFGGDSQQRWIDFSITLTANHGPIIMADTKEGTFALRVADTMRVDAKQGGRIVTSEGKTDKDAWAQPASWVDYHGPVAGQTVGIAILNHPSSFRYPTRWHVRTYGLFAANPFAVRDFTAEKKTDLTGPEMPYTLPAGQSLKLRYRILFHKGDEKEGRVAEAFAEYVK